MKDTVDFDLKTYMQQAQELADDPAAEQLKFSSTKLLAGTGKTEHTLDAFIKQKLMPNAQGKYWTKRQAHLFSGLCKIKCYDTYITPSRAHLLIWTWVMWGKQYGITLDHVRNVIRHWATHAAKLPAKTTSDDIDLLAGESEGKQDLRAAFEGLKEKRQQAHAQSKGLPLPFADYKEFYHSILFWANSC